MNPKLLKAIQLLLRFLPVETVSNYGAMMGRRRVKKAIDMKRLWVERFYNNLEEISGITCTQEKYKYLLEFGEEFGRLYAETIVMHKIEKQNRVEFTGLDNLSNTSRPCVFVAPHISNWEVLLKVSSLVENNTCDLYEPREDEHVMDAVYRARRVWTDRLKFLSTDNPMAMKELQNHLQEGTNLLIFPDEEKDGMVKAPSLGRKIDYAGNRWMLSRLAVKYSLDIIPLYVERLGPAKFKVHIQTKIESVADSNAPLTKREQAKQIADEIDVRFDRWVRKTPHLWFWLPYLKL